MEKLLLQGLEPATIDSDNGILAVMQVFNTSQPYLALANRCLIQPKP